MNSAVKQLLLYGGAIIAFSAILWYGSDYRKTFMAHQPLLPVAFDHVDHTATECFLCHHNFTDDTGRGTCYSCHKYDMTVAHLMEEQFHTLCRDCHTEERLAGQASGPVRSCDGCHLVEAFVSIAD